MSKGVILYGPPASGKDTITGELVDHFQGYELFHRIKIGGGSKGNYRNVSATHLQMLEDINEVIWRNEVYGATYVVDRSGLLSALQHGIPVLHLGQPEAIPAVLSAVQGARWLVVELLSDRASAARRLMQRDPISMMERLAVWDATPRLSEAHLIIDTGQTSPRHAARLIDSSVNGDCFPGLQ